MFKRLISAALVFGMAALAPPAGAQVACADRDFVVARLAEYYGEKLDALGLRTDRELIEIWSSDQAGTWTILMTRSDGTSCVVASGTGWTSKFLNPEKPDDPAS